MNTANGKKAVYRSTHPCFGRDGATVNSKLIHLAHPVLSNGKLNTVNSCYNDGKVEKQLLRGSQCSGRPLMITDEQLRQLLNAEQKTRC